MTKQFDQVSIRNSEKILWTMLDLDTVGKQMSEPVALGNDAHHMGTGSTVNACYSCSNSATTAGCGTCG